MSSLWTVAASFAGFAVLVAGYYAYGPISRSRVRSFARHARLAVTAGNGDQVIRYLAVTRRWRSAGFAAGAVASVLVSLPDRVSVNFLALFAGWFAGALCAELHLAFTASSTRRAASLDARTPDRYVSWFVWGLLPAASVVLVAPWPTGRRPVLWTAIGLAILLAVGLVRRSVLRRAQDPGEPDRVRADDAVRARSLHVLSGGGFTLAGLCGLAGWGGDPGVVVLIGLAIVLVGRYAASARGPLAYA
ncbi:hypothetical protein [Hamadaea tsunoensis]|uniref:hypothetical protein n=1 Tax=Hamadaea tsunoensis TaxID=53368 RepID=UPI000425DABB|nr:hypothetical protein [Hamadaea tsunoensis]